MLHILKQIEDLRLDRNVESRDRLVANNHLRVHNHGPGNTDALALAPRELMRAPGAGLVDVDTHRVEHFPNPRLDLFLCALLPNEEGFGDDVDDLAARIQRADRVLKDHLHLRTYGSHFVARQLGQVLAFEHNAARCRTGQLHNGPSRGRLAAPRLAHEPESFAFENVEADARHGVDLQLTAGDRKLDHKIFYSQHRLIGVSQVSFAGTSHISDPPRRRQAGRAWPRVAPETSIGIGDWRRWDR